MFDIGWSELLVIGMLALIVVGPKELPGLLRTIGQYVGKARSVAREFQRSMDEAARQADIDELKDVKKSLDEVRDVQYKAQREMSQSLLDGSPRKTAPKPAEKPAEAKAPEAEKPAEAPKADPAAAPSARTGEAGGA